MRKQKTEMRKQDKWMQLTNAINLRSSQDQVLWSIFGAFWGANAILLVALFTTGELPDDPIVGFIVSFVGPSLSAIWHIIQSRALGHLERFEALMSKLEKSLQIESAYAVSGDINKVDYLKYISKKFGAARKWMKACSTGGAIFWSLGFAYFILRALKCI